MATRIQPLVFADRLFQQNSALKDTLLILCGSLFIAALSQFVIPLAPVPITGQTFGVLLIGMLLGPWRGALALTLYLAEGAMGLPFFAGGLSGIGILTGATGGYLMGFVFAAFVTGWLAQRGWDRSFHKTGLIMLLGNIVIYATGLLWLSVALSGLEQPVNVFEVGLYPFIPGDLIKLALAAALMPSLWHFFGDPSKRKR